MSAESKRRWRENPANLAIENAARKSRRARGDPRVREADQRYDNSFKGVCRKHRHADQQALARLTQQVKEGIDSL